MAYSKISLDSKLDFRVLWRFSRRRACRFVQRGCDEMRRCFNIDGVCFADEHYMVNSLKRREEIMAYIDNKKYFVINRARQYGKTTTMSMIKQKLRDEYIIFFISFEGLGESAYENEYAFCRRVCGLLYDTIYYGEVEGLSGEIKEECYSRSLENGLKTDFRQLSNFISTICQQSDKPVILMIDEVDQASNQEIFISFLGVLRDKYLKRRNRPTFHSVILAGVYDIKNLKLKMRKNEEHQYNSPWNIAAKFTVDMSFSVEDISEMLDAYDKDVHTEMHIRRIAELIYAYTSGYPYLVSAICKIMDEQLLGKDMFVTLKDVWSDCGVAEAVRIFLKEPNTLFDDMIKHLAEYPELRCMLQEILFNGHNYPYNAYSMPISIGSMFGFVKEENGEVAIANRIFETHLYNYFIAEDISNQKETRISAPDKNQFVSKGFLDMDKVIYKFVDYYEDICQGCDVSFVEENARRLFLLYLKPIINGTGNYYVEARTRNNGRTDIVVDYRGNQYIIELKIYRGAEYNRKGEVQLTSYLESYHLQKGYLVSFNFNKNKKACIREVVCNGKTIVEVIV